jgi:hypothetical protein
MLVVVVTNLYDFENVLIVYAHESEVRTCGQALIFQEITELHLIL